MGRGGGHREGCSGPLRTVECPQDLDVQMAEEPQVVKTRSAGSHSAGGLPEEVLLRCQALSKDL